jgi:hypothetical protein
MQTQLLAAQERVEVQKLTITQLQQLHRSLRRHQSAIDNGERPRSATKDTVTATTTGSNKTRIDEEVKDREGSSGSSGVAVARILSTSASAAAIPSRPRPAGLPLPVTISAPAAAATLLPSSSAPSLVRPSSADDLSPHGNLSFLMLCLYATDLIDLLQ